MVASQYLPLVAHHEAGHAVAAIVLHRQTFDDDRELPAFSSVSIYPDAGDGECGGFVEGTVSIQRKDSPRSESRFSRTIWIDISNAMKRSK
ncbi:hypothetical protein [Mesorhizobium sp.]|uniref:hypothetical protein n=1 Tax=Mesorhizobium sp. TaxID=1871066 RepID=UPI00121B7373|nr:hypothetical protein [Mesorhizobium sp.]TJV14167.1 MAG: hypothetical protein E5Y07_27980 [Mesorhizobium sp.]